MPPLEPPSAAEGEAGEAPDLLDLLEDRSVLAFPGATRGSASAAVGGASGEEVADVEDRFQVELVTPEPEVETLSLDVVSRVSSTIEGFPVEALEVRKDAVAWAGHVQSLGGRFSAAKRGR
jgi:hypothetical protein